jgi:hypothetical protein
MSHMISYTRLPNPWTLALSAMLLLGGSAIGTPVSAAPAWLAQSAKPEQSGSLVEQVQHRRGAYRGYYRGGYRGRGVGIGAGIVGGAILGSMLAQQRYYGPYYGYRTYYYAAPPPPPAYFEPADDAVAYCMRRFRSYDPVSGTYLGYDGYRHPCP